jgi:hypothetical protein
MARLALIAASIFFLVACGSDAEKCLTAWDGYKQASVSQLVNGNNKYPDGSRVQIFRCFLFFRGQVNFAGDEYFAYEALESYDLLRGAYGCEKNPENFLVFSRSGLPEGTNLASLAGIWRENVQLDKMKTDILFPKILSFMDGRSKTCVLIEQ